LTRRRKIGLAVVLALVLVVGTFLLALPEIIRRVAVAQIPATLHRPTSIERVRVNVFTGRFAIDKLRVAERQGPDAFLEIERVEGRLWLPALFRSDIRFKEFRIIAPVVRIIRTGPAEFNFSDLLELFAPAEPKPPPSRFTATQDHISIERGRIVIEDHAVSPVADWSIKGLDVEGSGLTTKAGAEPGRLSMRLKLGDATLEITEQSLRLAPAVAVGKIVLRDFDLARLRPYMPPPSTVFADAGTLGVSLDVAFKREGDRARANASGTVTVNGLALSRGGGAGPFLTIPRVALLITQADVLDRDVSLGRLEVEGIDLQAVRDKEGQIDLLTLVQAREAPAESGDTKAAEPAPSPPPEQSSAPPWRVRLAQLAVKDAHVKLGDQSVTPPREWQVEGLSVDGANLSSSAEDPPGSLKLAAQIRSRPAPDASAKLTADVTSIRVEPLAAVVQLSLSGFDVMAAAPYFPKTLPASPSSGRLDLAVNATLQAQPGSPLRAEASGNVRLRDAALVQPGGDPPFFTVPSLNVVIKKVDPLSRTVDLAAVEVNGVNVRTVRDAHGAVNLLALTAPANAAPSVSPAVSTPAPESSGASKPTPASTPAWRLNLDRFTLAKGQITFEDHQVSPVSTLTVTDLSVKAEQLAWPGTRRATFAVSFVLPGGGRTEIKGTSVLEPLNAQFTLSTRDAPITPYQAYFPFAARFVGSFSGDSLNEVQRGPKGEFILASRGSAWARDLEARVPGGSGAVTGMAALEIRGIDFSWPNYALVDRVTLTKPHVEIERDQNGVINLKSLFTPRSSAAPEEKSAAPGAATVEPTAAGGGPDAPRGLLQTMVLDFNEIVIEDGHGRFIDRTTTPAFSEDITRLEVSIRDLSNVMGRRRTSLTAKAVVGGDATLDLRGELSGLGETLQADLVGELRDFTLSSANPYAETLTSWIVDRGKLTANIHYRIEGDKLLAEHEVKFNNLKVERARASDEVNRRIGIPLGLAVALLKDSRGDIDFTIPLQGTLGDRKFDWGEAMWSAVKQVIRKVLAAPFNAIGRLFSGGEDQPAKIEVNPVTFAAGSSVIAPAAELQATRIGDFLRRTPHVKLGLSAVASTADVESLKTQEVTAKLERFQQEQGLPDFATALRAYFQKHEPDLTLPKTPDEQLALLRQREPSPTVKLADLLSRRLEAARDRLVQTEGIPAERLVVAKAPSTDAAPAESGEGRVEFTIQAD
jgi:uncharacterized protein involved in outer membrane biogenesis